TDILSLFWTDLPPERRCGMARTSEASHWTYQPQKCDGPILLSALTLLRTEGDAATSVVGEKIKAAIERGNPKAVAEWNSINEEIGRILAP
ncbi:MAG: hypothetical protein KDJ16_02635, partial [Hyphomicrobiales bacterium]|nr:hypothetical protein [Hyphomicrobiales bacterium]